MDSILALWCLEFVHLSSCTYSFTLAVSSKDTCHERLDCCMEHWPYYTMSELKEKGILFIALLYHQLISFFTMATQGDTHKFCIGGISPIKHI